jgi:transposase InsO family protein
MLLQSSYFDAILREIYYDQEHPQGYGSIHGLYQAAKKIEKTVTRSYVRNWLQAQDVYTLHAPLRRRFLRRKTLAPGMFYQMQMDLVDLSNISKQNRGYKFLLTAIDIFSRKAFVLPLKSKKATTVRDAIAEIFTNYPPVRFLQCDDGLEFHNRLVKTYLASRNIRMFSTSSDVKAAIVERFNRTLKQRMFKYFTANDTVTYIDVLQKFVSAYNNRSHRAIGVAPNEVTHKNQNEVWKRQYRRYFIGYRKTTFKYNVDDRVRISKLARQFRKGYLKTYTEETFIVHNRIATVPVTYKLRDTADNVLIGSFYEPELQLVSK